MSKDKPKEYYGQKVDLGFVDKHIRLDNDAETKLLNATNLTLYTMKSKEAIEVTEEIGSGGEGKVYKCSKQEYVVKIYYKEHRKESLYKKLSLLIDNNPNSDRLCWPVDLVYFNDCFVGFLMPHANGKPLDVLATGNSEGIIRRNPKYNRTIQIDMLLSILEEIDKLHNLNILIGDIKGMNILFNKDTFDIMLVDMDSVQIAQFPCVTSTPGYDSPEVLLKYARSDNDVDMDKVKAKDKDGVYLFNNYYMNYYRTLKEEYHAVAVLLFKIIMNGLYPYDCTQYGMTGDPEELSNENIELCVKGKFPYGVNEENTNSGCDRNNIWSHLPSFIKECFVNTFTRKEVISVKEWIRKFELYKKLLATNGIKDKESNNVFPTSNISYDKVRIKLFEEFYAKGYLTLRAIIKLVNKCENENLNNYISEISEALNNQLEYMIDNYTFSLVYNIGILKKIKCKVEL